MSVWGFCASNAQEDQVNHIISVQLFGAFGGLGGKRLKTN